MFSILPNACVNGLASEGFTLKPGPVYHLALEDWSFRLSLKTVVPPGYIRTDPSSHLALFTPHQAPPSWLWRLGAGSCTSWRWSSPEWSSNPPVGTSRVFRMCMVCGWKRPWPPTLQSAVPHECGHLQAAHGDAIRKNVASSHHCHLGHLSGDS